MDLKMIMYLFSACVLICAVAGQCPSPNDPALNLESNNSLAVIRSYASIKTQMSAPSADRRSQMFLDIFEKSKCGDLGTVRGDNPDGKSRSVSNPWPVFAVPQTASQCEPCPPNVHFLGRFYSSCYVIEPKVQELRYVTCGKTCQQPCMCSRSYCQQTHYIKVWFPSFCTRNVGGFQRGFNFRFLWLPQDCTCRNY